MVLPDIFKKASTLFHNQPKSRSLDCYGDGDIVFSKNNVCVHSNITSERNIHQPGYLTLSYKSQPSRKNQLNDFTLQLTWIPNSMLQFSKDIFITNRNALILGRAQSVNEFEYNKKPSFEYGYIYIDKANREFNLSSNSSTCSEEYVMFDCNKFPANDFSKNENQKIVSCDASTFVTEGSKSELSPDYLQNNSNVPEISINNVENSDLDSSIFYSDYEIIDKEGKSIRHSINNNEKNESDKYSNEMNFYDNWRKESITSRQTCRKFSVDLGKMKSIRLFFSNDDNRNGELVIASTENQYKILHFHYGGLEKLQDVLLQWDSSICYPIFVKNEDVPYKHFIICQSSTKNSDHPYEEEQIQEISYNTWYSMLNELGQVEDDVILRKAIFFGRLHKSIRRIVWPFLLNCYPYESTAEERNELRNVHKQEYTRIERTKQTLLEDHKDNYLKTINHIIHEDVIRTDRMHPFYIGDDNPNLNIMKNILLNYAVFDCNHGYTQGMSDLLAPVLAEIEDEVETFWCFVSLMKRCLFVCTPTDSDMETNLMYLRELIRLMYPKFYFYLKNQTDGLELLFCHRWLLLCFKREFPIEDVLRIWESCWSNYLTNYFHLFICLAIITTYSDDVIDKKLRSDEILFYFNSLAKCMNGNEIVKKARKLLRSFKLLTEVPPILSSLCQQGSDSWDSRHIPVCENLN